MNVAHIADAGHKWIQNTRRLLNRTAANDPRDARWLGITHTLHSTLGCSLREAARVADLALEAPLDQHWLRIQLDGSGRAELVIDLWRDHSIHLARLAWSLANPNAERRGRPRTKAPTRASPIKRAIQYGIDVPRLKAGLHRSVAERLRTLDDNVAFVAAGRASLAKRAK